MTSCYYCQSEAFVCCEERLSGDDKKTCPRAVCKRHGALVDGTWKCLGHSLPPDAKKPWEKK